MGEADCGPATLSWAGRRAELASHLLYRTAHFKLTIFILFCDSLLGLRRHSRESGNPDLAETRVLAWATLPHLPSDPHLRVS
jgi:hypothetical protein